MWKLILAGVLILTNLLLLVLGIVNSWYHNFCLRVYSDWRILLIVCDKLSLLSLCSSRYWSHYFVKGHHCALYNHLTLDFIVLHIEYDHLPNSGHQTLLILDSVRSCDFYYKFSRAATIIVELLSSRDIMFFLKSATV